MRNKFMFLIVAVLMLLNVTVTTNAIGHSKKSIVLISNKTITIRLYQTGKVNLIHNKKTYKLADDGQCRYAGIDKYGNVYMLMKDNCVYSLDYKNRYGLGYNKFKKYKLIKLDKNVKNIQANKYGYIKSYIKHNHKVYNLTKNNIRRLWKKAMKQYKK